MRGLGEKMVFDWVRWILAQKVSTLEPAEKLVRAWELGCGVRLDAAEVLELLQDGHISAAAKLSAEASVIAGPPILPPRRLSELAWQPWSRSSAKS